IDPAREVEPDAVLAYDPNRPRPETAARRIRVLYQDRYILIVDKPAGLLTQPTQEREPDTLLERAGRYLAETGRGATIRRDCAPARPGHLGRDPRGVLAP